MLQSSKLLQFPFLWHGFSTINEGRLWENTNFFQSQSCIVRYPDQTHSSIIAQEKKDSPHGSPIDADGLITTESKVCIGVKTADCVPILFIDPETKIVAAIHAGWRGLLGHIIQNAINHMQTLGAEKKNIFAAIGPHIGTCCYSVDSGRIKLFENEFNTDSLVIIKKAGEGYLDLGRASFLYLIRSGLQEKQIDLLDFCTSCDHSFYSYRRDKVKSERMFNFICLKN